MQLVDKNSEENDRQGAKNLRVRSILQKRNRDIKKINIVKK